MHRTAKTILACVLLSLSCYSTASSAAPITIDLDGLDRAFVRGDVIRWLRFPPTP